MKKKLLVTGLMVATMMTVSACGSKNTTAETTAATEITTVAETTTEEATTEELSEEVTDGESLEAADGESQASASLTVDQIAEFSQEVQEAVAAKDMEWLADLCDYPVVVSLNSGESSEIEDHDAFVALGVENVFTDEFLAEIAAVNIEELEQAEAGVIMGEESSIIFNNVDGGPAITGLNL